MWNDVHKRGLLYVHQLFENKQYKSEEQVWLQYGLTRLRYNSLKTIIPKEWKEFFQTYDKTQYFPLQPHVLDTCVCRYSQNISKRVYSFISEDVMLLHNKYMKWRQELGENFCESLIDYAMEHNRIYRTTNIAKYRSFQYRLLQRALVTNIQLKEWKIIDSEKCTFCGEVDETVIHLFVECTKTQTLWKEVKEYILERYNINIPILTSVEIIFNRIESKIGSIANLQKCIQNELSAKGVIKIIEQTERTQ